MFANQFIPNQIPQNQMPYNPLMQNFSGQNQVPLMNPQAQMQNAHIGECKTMYTHPWYNLKPGSYKISPSSKEGKI